MLGIQAAVIVTAGPLLVFLGVLRMLRECVRLLLEMGHSVASNFIWLMS